MLKSTTDTKNSRPVFEWGVVEGDNVFTLRRGDNLFLDAPFVNSNVNANMTSEFSLNDGTELRPLLGRGKGVMWGQGGGMIGGDRIEQPLPEHLKLTYFSYLENQFYQLDTPLPTEKIRQIFSSNYLGTHINDNVAKGRQLYKDFYIAVGVDGWVMLFAGSYNGNLIQIGGWQAKKINGDYAVDVNYSNSSGGDIEWLRKMNFREESYQDNLKLAQKLAPKIYQDMISGKGTPTNDWLKMIQTKFPWNVEVSGDGSTWLHEYYIEYANLERYETLRDQLDTHKKQLKAVPIRIGTWVTENATNLKYYVEIHLYPRPKWSASGLYTPYDKDPNLTRLFKQFQHFYPTRSLATNDQPAKPEDFATLKIHLNIDGKMDDIYIQKGNEKLPIDGAYEYYLAEVDPNEGGYKAKEEGFDHFVTEPKAKDLSDPSFVDLH